jgi:hypothetical protein
MLELGYKHGPFDFRYPVRRKIPTPVWVLERDRDGPGRLEWYSFLTRFFPNRRRHDFEALAAYDGYRNALDRAASLHGSAPCGPASASGRHAERSVVSSLPRAKRVLAAAVALGAARTVFRSPALADWESEGGRVDRDSD